MNWKWFIGKVSGKMEYVIADDKSMLPPTATGVAPLHNPPSAKQIDTLKKQGYEVTVLRRGG